MSKSWTLRAVGPLAVALSMTACTGRGDGSNTDRQAARPDGPGAATIALTGCLEAAPGTDRYVLRSVRFEPRTGGDPHAATTTSGGHGITEGAWVRVDGGGRKLDDLLGQRVVLKGVITDDGRNTIGTAGAPGVQTPTGETSQAASSEHHAGTVKTEAGRMARESMADGTAAEVRVQDISSRGERCATPR